MFPKNAKLSGSAAQGTTGFCGRCCFVLAVVVYGDCLQNLSKFSWNKRRAWFVDDLKLPITYKLLLAILAGAGCLPVKCFQPSTGTSKLSQWRASAAAIIHEKKCHCV